MVLERLRRDEALQLDELIERLEAANSAPREIFTALFELELAAASSRCRARTMCAAL